MTIDEILENMDDLLDRAVNVPFSGKKSMVDVDKMREYIDAIRYNMPTEIMQAKEMVTDRSQILTDGKKEAEATIKRAEDRSKLLVSQQEIVKKAKEKATEIITNAQNMERDIKKAMAEKMDEMLDETELILNKNIADIRQTRTALKSISKKR